MFFLSSGSGVFIEVNSGGGGWNFFFLLVGGSEISGVPPPPPTPSQVYLNGTALTLLSTIFQLYRGGQLCWWRKPEYPENTTDLSQVTDKRYHASL